MAKPDAPANAPDDAEPSGPYTLRATFAYKGDELRLTGTQRVRMIAPPAVTPAPERGQSGYWLEVRDAAGKLLYHRALHAPIRVDVEVYGRGPEQPITRVPLPVPEGEFDVLVPDLPAAQSFTLYGPPADARLQSGPARELIRVGFDALRRPPRDTPPREGR